MKILFVNTAVPVVPLWEDSFPEMRDLGFEPAALVSASDYRSESAGKEQESVIRLPCPGFAGKSRLLRHFFFALRAPITILARRPDRVVFLTQPPLFHVFGSVLCRILRIPYAVHMMDQYPEILEASGVIRQNGALARLFKRTVRRSYQSARGVISIGPCVSTMLRESYGVDDTLIREVPNWPFDGIVPVLPADNKFLSERGWQKDFVVLYSGNLGLGHEIGTILAAARHYRNDERIRFAFVGGGRGYDKLREECRDLPRVEFLPFQLRDRLAETLSSASLHFITLRMEFSGLMVPSKLYGCLASGRPVLFAGPSDSTVAQTVQTGACGTVVQNEDVDGLIAAIESYLVNPERGCIEGEAARRCYESNHAPKISAHRYAEAIQSIFARPNE